MRCKMAVTAAVLAAVFVSGSGASWAETELVRHFRIALYAGDPDGMRAIVRENRDRIPGEIKGLIDDALASGKPARDREKEFYVAEFMAEEYKNVTGDIALLKDVKRRIFDSRLSAPVRPPADNGVYVVEARSTDKAENVFNPENIIIKKGGTVKWVNNDHVAHLLASVPVIGEGGLFSPTLEPGQSWRYRFDKPGVYYYICFIHKVMYGRVTVEE